MLDWCVIYTYTYMMYHHAEKISVWCALSQMWNLEPPVFWIQCRWRCLQIFCAAICGFVLEPDECNHWFRQDSATCHTANETMNILRHFFGDCLISKNISPPQYPELTLSDFFLWGHLKERTYNDNPLTLNDVTKTILQE